MGKGVKLMVVAEGINESYISKYYFTFAIQDVSVEGKAKQFK